MKAILYPRRDRCNLEIEHPGKPVIVSIKRLRNQNLVAGIERDQQREQSRFAAAGGDVDLRAL